MAYIKDCCLKPARWYCDCPAPEPEPEEVDSQITAMATVPCIYLGDMLSTLNERVASAVVYHENKMYVLSIQKTVTSAAGWVTIFDTTTNHRISDIEIPYIAHANGFCWDDKRKQFIIAPVFQTASSSSGRNYNLIIANEDFTSISQLPIVDKDGIQINAMGVSYDYVNEKTYVYAYAGHTIYEYTGTSQLAKVSTVDYLPHGFDMNQGFAVKDGIFYLSSPHSNFIIGSVATGTIYGEKCVANTDDIGRRMLGELEDWEFGADGILYAVRLTQLSAAKGSEYPGYVVNLITAVAVDRFLLPSFMQATATWSRHYEGFTLGHGSITWNATTDFWNSVSTIRRPEQLDMLYLDADSATQINITNTALNSIDFGVIYINRPQFWHFATSNIKIKCTKIYVNAPLNIYCAVGCSGNGLIMSQPGGHFLVDRCGELTLSGGGERLSFTLPNSEYLDIAVGYCMTFTKVYKTPEVNGTADPSLTHIGTNTFEDVRGLFMGGTQIFSYTA